jgi:hypothetical protein
MYLPLVESDQLYTWSDTCARENLFHFAETPPISSAATAPTYRDPPWFTHRTLQALWQAGLQVRQGPGPRSQVLPVGKLSGLSTSDGLCTARALRSDHRIPCQLPTNSRDFRGNLRDQPRTITASRGALRSRDGRRTFCVHRTIGNGNWRRPSGQYARSLARRRCKCLDSGGVSR